MNEEGKSFFSCYSSVLFLLFIGFSFVPYADLFKEENITRLVGGEDMPEKLVIFMYCAVFFVFLWILSYLGTFLLSLVVHLFMRLFFLYKLRKPMLLYTGNPDYKAPEFDRFSKIGKIITFLNFERFVEILMFAVCFFSLLCMCFAEW